MTLDEIDNLVTHTISKTRCSRETVRKIHPELNTYYNSINVLVGRQNCGKTYTVLKELIKIGYVDEITHLLIYVTKDGRANDETYNTLKHLISIPVIFVSQEEAEKVVRTILEYKNLYNKIKGDHLENRIVDEQVNELKKVLMIRDLKLPYLHTIIFFEDSANNPLFKKPTLFFPQLISKCRHVGCSFFFAVQFWKSIPTELKANLSAIYIFPSYSKQQLHYILNQIPLSETFEEIYASYQMLNVHDKIVVDVIEGEVFVVTES
jgi:hypothetical protein